MEQIEIIVVFQSDQSNLNINFFILDVQIYALVARKSILFSINHNF